MRRALRWCGFGILGVLLACNEFGVIPETSSATYDPTNPTTLPPTTGPGCSNTGETCEADSDCCYDDICLPSGVCGRIADGEPCTSNEQCASDFCSSTGICGCIADGLSCEGAAGDCCGGCDAQNICYEDASDCGGSGTYCGIFGGSSCCHGYYCDLSFFGSYCEKSPDPPPDPDPDSDSAADSTTNTTSDTTTGTTTNTTTATETDPSTGPPPDLPPPDPECGDGEVNGDEVCDGQDLGAGQCVDFAGFGGGALACTPGCTYDTSGCCNATNQPCAADSECCPGTACKFDVLMLKNVCK